MSIATQAKIIWSNDFNEVESALNEWLLNNFGIITVSSIQEMQDKSVYAFMVVYTIDVRNIEDIKN